MKLYGCAKTRSDRVRWTLEEAGAAYEYVPVDLFNGGARTPAFLAINPQGKVPVLEVEGQYLTESAAMCRLVADRHPAAHLIPAPGTVARARCEQWCDFAISELEQPLWSISKHRFALPPDKRVAAMLDTAAWEFARAAGMLATGLGGNTWILGDTFSVADVLLGHTLAWAHACKLELVAPNVQAYAQRVLARPALQRVRELNAA